MMKNVGERIPTVRSKFEFGQDSAVSGRCSWADVYDVTWSIENKSLLLTLTIDQFHVCRLRSTSYLR